MYERLVVPLVHIAKRHRQRIEALEAQNVTLTQQLAELSARVEALEGAA